MTTRLSPRTAGILYLALLMAMVLAAALAPRIPQPLLYHHFADRRALWNIPNFADVVSNVPFAVFGIWGLLFLAGRPGRSAFVVPQERIPYFAFFVGLLLTAFGSAYYHFAPDNARLVWDRIPMTIVFASLVAALVAERVSVKLGVRLLPFLLALGLLSVLQWYYSEINGAGDLSLYASVQLGSLLALILALDLPARYTRSFDLGVVAALYIFAKMFELWDRDIFNTLHLVSGHTLKHLVAAAAGFWILRMLKHRQPIVRIGDETAPSALPADL